MGGNIPYNLKGAKLAMAWDPAKDEADGNQCKAFGAMGIMRLPERLHVSWQDDNTLKLEFDFGKQTRLFHFVPEPPQAQPGGRFVSDKLMPQAPSGPPSLQGFSVAAWHAMGGTRPDWPKGGNLEVVTNNLQPGYYWRNGMPYSGNAILTEHFRTFDIKGDQWFVFSQLVEDPAYLTQPYMIEYQFKKQANAEGWNPTPCSVK